MDFTDTSKVSLHSVPDDCINCRLGDGRMYHRKTKMFGRCLERPPRPGLHGASHSFMRTCCEVIPWCEEYPSLRILAWESDAVRQQCEPALFVQFCVRSCPWGYGFDLLEDPGHRNPTYVWCFDVEDGSEGSACAALMRRRCLR